MKYILLMLILISIAGCSENQSKEIIMLNEFKKVVDSSVFVGIEKYDELFENGTNQNILYPAMINKSAFCGLFFNKSIESSDAFYNEILKLKKVKKQKTKIKDTCNFLVPDDIKYGNILPCKNEKYPVPNLNDKFVNYNELDINNIDFFVLKSKKGFFLKDKGILRQNKIANDHGFSNGAIVNYDSKEITYWVVIW